MEEIHPLYPGLGEERRQPLDRARCVFGENHPPIAIEPDQSGLDEPRARSVGGDPVRSQPAKRRVDYGRPGAYPVVAVHALFELGTVGRGGKWPVAVEPEGVPALRPHELVSDEIPILSERIALADGQPHRSRESRSQATRLAGPRSLCCGLAQGRPGQSWSTSRPRALSNVG